MAELIRRDALGGVDFSDTVTTGYVEPATPGGVLRDEFLLPLGLSARALSREIGVPANRITEIINGERAVTAETAVLLGLRFKTSAEFWMRLQAAHDLELAQRSQRVKLAARMRLLQGKQRTHGRDRKIAGALQPDDTRVAGWLAELEALERDRLRLLQRKT